MKTKKTKIRPEFGNEIKEEIMEEVSNSKVEDWNGPTKELIAPLEFSHGLHPTQEEFNEVVAKLNEVIKKVN